MNTPYHGAEPDQPPDRPDQPPDRPDQSAGSGPPPQYPPLQPSQQGRPPPSYGPPQPPSAGYGDGPGPYAPPPAYGPPPGYGPSPFGSPYGAAPGGFPPNATGTVEVPGRGPVRLATVGQRALARILDTVIIAAIIVVLLSAGVGSLMGFTDAEGNPTAPGVATFATITLLVAAIGLAYEVVLIALRGATLGKMMMGVRVIRSGDGGVPGWGPSALRWLVPTVPVLFCGLLPLLVYLSALFDTTGRLQGWHDKAASTFVVATW